MTIHVICSVCEKKYNEKQDGKTRVIESHGYCEECLPWVMNDIHSQLRDLKPNQPCGHPGCCAHRTHPCEGCGRIG